MKKHREIADLEWQIRQANIAYYDEDDPVLTDSEYDKLKQQLEELDPGNPVLLEIGNPTYGEKFTHESMMCSLKKCHTAQEILDKFYGRVVVMMPKVDGFSLSLHYDHGSLKTAVTRGDGHIGEVVTPNVVRMLGVPLEIYHKEKVEIRGEGYISPTDFYGIMDRKGYAGKDNGFANPRNAAAGSVRQKDPAITPQRKVRFVAYRVLGAGYVYHDDALAWLEMQNFQVTPYWSYNPVSEDGVQTMIESIKNYSVPFETDGIVVMLQNLEEFEAEGVTGKEPKAALAYKFETEKAATMVENIVWQTGRTGKITPVAIIEPTHICGSTVARISLHSLEWLRKKDVCIGDKILFEKANEIIPEVVKVLQEAPVRDINLPEYCPACGGDVAEEGADLMCKNPECDAQLIKHVRFILETLRIKGIGENSIAKMCDGGLVNYTWQIFDITEENLVEVGFGPGESNKMAAAVKQVKASPSRLMACLGIRGWGESMFEKLFKKSQIAGQDWLLLFAGLFDDGREGFDAHIDSMGDVRPRDLREGLSLPDKQELLSRLLENVEVESAAKSGVLAGSTFCITGSLSKPRSQIADDIKAAGGVVKDSVTKNLDYLVAGSSTGSKLDKAKAAGVLVIKEGELYAMMRGKHASLLL